MAEYIERKAFKNNLMTAMINKTADGDALAMKLGMLMCALADCEPAADVAPVVHGEWERILCDEDAYEHHRCSICKEYARFSYLDETVFDENSDGEMEECGTVTVDIIEDLTPFCPLCGAKMEGVRNEEACR